jgi:CRP-like cAMP-binding protein
MADMIGTTRQSVSETLGVLRRQGLLRVNQRRIHIQNGKVLESLANAAAGAVAV